jgi:glycosyltransferase involved in cell wall biosynthesis
MNDHIAILMGTYQGERFLVEQLESISKQTHKNWRLWVSDDGSTDATVRIITEFQERTHSAVTVLQGPRKGFLQNFMSLICNVAIDADFYCFADQDDKWLPKKLERGLRWQQTQSRDVPALYCTRTRNVNADGKPIGFSPLFRRPPSFSNALVQSISGANTMMMNRAARDLLIKAGRDVNVPSHDWWSYILTTGAGGIVHYDPIAEIDYRQHDGNQVGSNSDFRARLRRLRMLRSGRFREWSERHLSALALADPLLTVDNRRKVQLFRELHSGAFPKNLWALRAAGLYRQTIAGNIGLAVAAVLRQI